MRWGFVAVAVLLAACNATPPVEPSPSTPGPVVQRPTVEPTASPTPEPSLTTFWFDVENHSRMTVVVSVVSDRAAQVPGFGPGQRGSIWLTLVNPQNGISIEFQGPECSLIGTARYPTPEPFTLLITDGDRSGAISWSTQPGISETHIPLPTDQLGGCGG